MHRYEGASHLVTEDAPAAIDDIRRLGGAAALGVGRAEEAAPPAADRHRPPRPGVGGGAPMGAALAERAADPGTPTAPAVVELGGAGIAR